jgi:hypothetical protein
MKRATLILLSCALILFGGTQAMGNECDQPPQVQRIKLVPKEGQQDLVDIRFKIDAQGKVQVVSVEASNAKLVDYVINKLQAIQLEPNLDEQDRIYRYKFRFKDQT